MHRSLSELPVGASGVVLRVTGERAVRRRLLELGLVPGTPVAVTNIAPLGDPLELEVRGCRLSIRHAEADTIELEEHAETPRGRWRARRRLPVRT